MDSIEQIKTPEVYTSGVFSFFILFSLVDEFYEILYRHRLCEIVSLKKLTAHFRKAFVLLLSFYALSE